MSCFETHYKETTGAKHSSCICSDNTITLPNIIPVVIGDIIFKMQLVAIRLPPPHYAMIVCSWFLWGRIFINSGLLGDNKYKFL